MFKINKKTINEKRSPFIIAEAGINHNGNIGLALKMIKVAANSGCDAIKFQTFKASEFVSDKIEKIYYPYKGKNVSESIYDMFKRCELPESAWFRIKKECIKRKIIFFSTPQNQSDLEILKRVGVPLIKIGSDDFTNLKLLRDFSKTKKPIILSCGMSDLSDVRESLKAVGALKGYPTALLVCTSQYPTPAEDVNLKKITTLKSLYKNIPIGFSDHTQGHLAASLAVGLGACIFEKHFTLNNNFKGPDHWFSANPSDLELWAKNIKLSHKMLGSYLIKPTKKELKLRDQVRRKIVAKEKINKGTKFSHQNLCLKRVNISKALPAKLLDNLIGKKSNKKYKPNEPIKL